MKVYKVALLCNNKTFAESLEIALNQFDEIEIKLIGSFETFIPNDTDLLLIEPNNENIVEQIIKIRKMNLKIKVILITKFPEFFIKSELFKAGISDVIYLFSGKYEYKHKILNSILNY